MLLDLIEANLQDQTTHEYEDWPALLGYCRLSAAPVGRIVLELFRVDDARAQALSDDVCIGLQLANFAQDVSNDSARGRTYLLQADLRRGEISAVASMCERARALLKSGLELEGMVEMILDRFLPAGDHHQHVVDPRPRGLFHHVLNHRPVQHREHFLGHRLGRREHARAETGGGDDGFGDLP